VVPPKNRVSVYLRSSFRLFRSTTARPSTTSGQPSFVLPPLQVNRHPDHTYFDPGHLRTLGVAGASPAEKQSNVQRGSRGRQPPCGGLGAEPPRPTESVDRHSSEDFRCRSACEDREMRSASTPSLEPRFWVKKASSASGRERCERTATPRIHPAGRTLVQPSLVAPLHPSLSANFSSLAPSCYPEGL